VLSAVATGRTESVSGEVSQAVALNEGFQAALLVAAGIVVVAARGDRGGGTGLSPVNGRQRLRAHRDRRAGTRLVNRHTTERPGPPTGRRTNPKRSTLTLLAPSMAPEGIDADKSLQIGAIARDGQRNHDPRVGGSSPSSGIPNAAVSPMLGVGEVKAGAGVPFGTLIAVGGDAAGVLEHPRHVEHVPGGEGRVAVGEVVVGSA
jgi:hypothetical protein